VLNSIKIPKISTLKANIKIASRHFSNVQKRSKMLYIGARWWNYQHIYLMVSPKKQLGLWIHGPENIE
jgi:hypothetical protein